MNQDTKKLKKVEDAIHEFLIPASDLGGDTWEFKSWKKTIAKAAIRATTDHYTPKTDLEWDCPEHYMPQDAPKVPRAIILQHKQNEPIVKTTEGE